jgi:hypothetical protein
MTLSQPIIGRIGLIHLSRSELADRAPLVLGLDDAHWADELTLRLLRVTARRAGELPLGLVVAVRPTALGRPDAVLAAERAFVRLEPAPLSLAGTGRLVGQVLGHAGDLNVLARLRSVTRGNPLYLRELLDALRAGGRDLAAATPLEDDVPAPLVQLIADRLDRLPPAAADLARAIAVLGGDATATRARRLAELAPAAALEAEEILRRERMLDAGRYEFVHPVVVAAVRDGLGAVNSAKLHARAARLLASDGLDEERVAEHLVRATPEGDPFVVTTLRRAADTARRIGAYAAAARLLARASEEPPPPELADTVTFELGRSLLHAGAEDGVRILTQLLHDTLDASMRARCASGLAGRLGLAGRHEDAGALLRDVVASLDASDRELRPQLVVELASATGSRASGLGEAAALITAEKKRCRGQTAGERLLLAAASRIDGERTRDGHTAAAIAHALLEQRIQRDFPAGYAAGSIIFWAMSILIKRGRARRRRARDDAPAS